MRINNKRIMKDKTFSGDGKSYIRTADLFIVKEQLLKSFSRYLNSISSPINMGGMIPGIPVSLFILFGDSIIPNYHEGDLILTQPAREVKTGDVIVFQEQIQNKIIIHRVIRQGCKGYITQGDANSAPDLNPVPYSTLLGKVVIRIPNVGKIIKILQRVR